MTRVIDSGDIAKWDPESTERMLGLIRPIAKGWHRFEVRGLRSLPSGAALVVSNHSGGLTPMDVPVFALGFYDEFGYERPVYTLSHDILFRGPVAEFLLRTGFIPASSRNAAAVLRSGAVVMVFPGGDYDVTRPTTSRNRIDFGGRTGYVRTAMECGAPIVPTVSIGGQENQLYLSRGETLGRLLRLNKLIRAEGLPIAFGFPFGISMVLPVNLPLPTKIVTQVLDPIDVVARFGDDADVDEVDAHVRSVMQEGLDELSAERRFPVLG